MCMCRPGCIHCHWEIISVREYITARTFWAEIAQVSLRPTDATERLMQICCKSVGHEILFEKMHLAAG